MPLKAIVPPKDPIEVPVKPADPVVPAARPKAGSGPRAKPEARTPAPKPAADPDPILERVKAAICYIEGKGGSGTAFVVRPGILATNNHILQDEYIDDLRVRFVSADDPTAKPLPVKLLYRDRSRDLALLAVKCDQEPLKLAAGKPLKGHKIAVVGHPRRFGGVVQQLHAVTEGTVEELVLAAREAWYHLKADAAPGNSGGPVVDRTTGEVIGILTFGLREQMEEREAARIRRAWGAEVPKKEPRDTFCIPGVFVRDAITEVESALDRDKLSNEVTARYAAERVTLYLCVAHAANKVAKEALFQVRRYGRFGVPDITVSVERYLKLHDRLMSSLRPAILHVQTTQHLPQSIKRTISRVLQNSEEMKRMVENPRSRARTVPEYNQKYDTLEKGNQTLLKGLFKELGLPDSVKIRLLD